MSCTMRILRSLVDNIRKDLARPHAFAAERVGHLFTRIGNRDGAELLVLAIDYVSVPDTDYIRNPRVGACYGPEVHRRNMARAARGDVGVYHVHQHEGDGVPRFSRVDLQSIPAFVPSLRAVAPRQIHGALLLSENSLTCLSWLPGQSEPARAVRIALVGWPLELIEVRHG